MALFLWGKSFMAILWQSSLVPFTDPNGNPYSGAKAYFFDATTTTPRVVFREYDLDNPHDHPVVANSSGMFPPVFLPAGLFRLRIEDANGVTIWDVDGISAPASSEVAPPDAGGTDITLLARTGDLKPRFGIGAHSGWVRCNSRTIGNTLSGATERANSDCENLFVYLWELDAGLAVSGGRGATSSGDWASDKTIALPDFRGYSIVGLDGMGHTRANRIPDSYIISGTDTDSLGAVAGYASWALTTAQMPSHAHGGTTTQNGLHSHGQRYGAVANRAGGTFEWFSVALSGETGVQTSSDGLHLHGIALEGGGGSHPNVQPSKFATIYIKL